jgi:hypothetical protein
MPMKRMKSCKAFCAEDYRNVYSYFWNAWHSSRFPLFHAQNQV